MRALSTVLSCVLFAACGGDDGGNSWIPVDGAAGAQDSASSADGAPARMGLDVRFMPADPIPGTITGTTSTLTTLSLFADRIEAIGDAGTSMATTAMDVPLEFANGVLAQGVAFEFAPFAIYSKVRVTVDAGPATEPALDLTGTVEVLGATEQLHVVSTQKLDIEVSGYNVMLGLSGLATMDVTIDLEEALSVIDWAGVRRVNNVITLDDTDTARMMIFLNALGRGFVQPPQ